MTTVALPADRLGRKWRQAVDSSSADAARTLVQRELNAGVPGAVLIRSLFVPTLREIGGRWQSGAASVAQEYAVTSLVDTALAVIEHEARDVAVPPAGEPEVVLVSVETEWHTMPARLAAQLVREAGTAVRLVVPAVSPLRLDELLTGTRPRLLAVSTTMPTALPAAARCIAVARSAGVPVVVGGAAFGADDRRAVALGAQAWSADADAIGALAGELEWAPASSAGPDWEGYRSVRDRSTPLSVVHERLKGTPAGAAVVTRDDLRNSLAALAAALLVDDLRIVDDWTRWWCSVMAARGVGPGAVAAAYRALADDLFGPGRVALQQAADRLLADEPPGVRRAGPGSPGAVR